MDYLIRLYLITNYAICLVLLSYAYWQSKKTLRKERLELIQVYARYTQYFGKIYSIMAEGSRIALKYWKLTDVIRKMADGEPVFHRRFGQLLQQTGIMKRRNQFLESLKSKYRRRKDKCKSSSK